MAEAGKPELQRQDVQRQDVQRQDVQRQDVQRQDVQRQEIQRQSLLADLFGRDVPTSLEGQLLRTSDVATLFQVSERTVSEWAKRGRIPSLRTPGGHRRYPADQIRSLLQETEDPGGSWADPPSLASRPGRPPRPAGAREQRADS